MGIPSNSYSPFPWILQIFPAGASQFPVSVVFIVKTFAVRINNNKGIHSYDMELIVTLCINMHKMQGK